MQLSRPSNDRQCPTSYITAIHAASLRSLGLRPPRIRGVVNYETVIQHGKRHTGCRMIKDEKKCKTCELTAHRSMGTAPLWDCIHRTQFWDVAHAFNTSLPGWLVLIVQRHIEAIDELTDEEAAELGPLIHHASLALKEATGCLKTYVMQFAEHEDHPHVHFHIVPRMADQPEDRRSTQVFAYLGVPQEEIVSEDQMNAIALKIQRVLLAKRKAE